MTSARLIALLMIALLVGIPAVAQDGYPLPEDLPPITPENAAQVTELGRVGGGLPGDLVWSPDGSILAAGTSAGVKLYDADDLTATPRLIPDGGKDLLFNPTGTILVSGGQIWNARTGNAIAPIGAADTREFSPSGNILVTSRFEEGETRVFLWDARGKPLATLDTDSALVFRGVVFNADESLMAVKLTNYSSPYLEAGIVQLWNIKTGVMIAVFGNSYNVIDTVAFVANGRYLVVESVINGMHYGLSSDIRVWDTRSGDIVWDIENAFDPAVSPDGTLLVYEREGKAQGIVFDTLETFELNNGDDFNYNRSWFFQSFSPDGNTLAAAGSNKDLVVAIWTFNQGQLPSQPRAVLPGSEYVFSPSGHILATLDNRSHAVHIWDVKTGTEVKTLESNFLGPVYSRLRMQFNPTGERLSVYNPYNLEVWDVKTGESLVRLNLTQYVNFNSIMTHAAYWENGAVHVTDLETGVDIVLPVITDYYGSALAMNVQMGKIAFSGHELRVYDLLTGLQDWHFNSIPQAVTFTSDENILLAWENVPADSDVMTLTVHDMKSSSLDLSSSTLGTTETNRNGTIAFSTTGYLLAWPIVNQTSSIEKLFNFKAEELKACWVQPDEQIQTNTFTPDGKLLLTGSFSPKNQIISFTLWDIENILQTETLFGCPPLEYRSMLSVSEYSDYSQVLDTVFSPNGGKVALSVDFFLAGEGESAHQYYVYLVNTDDLLNSGTSLTLNEMKHVALPRAYSPRFSPDGVLLLTVSDSDVDGRSDTFDVWDAETGEAVSTFAGDGAAAFSGDGSLLATHGENGISLWEVASLVDDASPQPLILLPDSEQAAVELAFSPDNSRLYGRWSGGVVVYGVD